MPLVPVALIAAIACAPEPTDALRHLSRASMSIRGVRPSMEEIQAVRDDPGRLADLAVAWLDDPRFGETVRDMHAEQFLLRIDARDHVGAVGPLAGHTRAEIAASLDEGPLMLIERVVTEGRPYTEIVTGPPLADPITAAAHGLDHDPDGPAWQETRWTDGRPTAGILSSTTLWQRYMSSNVNLHRSRASFVLSQLLCEPLPTGAVSSRPTSADALATDPACAGCHRTLDPLASAFYGFADYVLANDIERAVESGCPPEAAAACLPLPFWDPARVALREADGMPPPALYGEPVDDVAELGRRIAAAPQFASCTARRFASWLAQIPPEEVPDDVVDELTDALVAADFDAREVVLALVLDPAFADPDGWVGTLRVRPEQLARTVADLTGWRWRRTVSGYGTVDLLTTDAYGYRTLAGGVDGWDTVRPVHAPTASRELVLARVAEQAAAHAVDTGRWPPGGGGTGRRDVRRALEHLSMRITGVPGADVSAYEGLFDGALARSGDAAHAWKVTIAAMLHDPAAERY